MVDEVDKIDYEKLIGDMPTWFKYCTVYKNSYGVSTGEILFAKDTALKKFLPYPRRVRRKSGGQERGRVELYRWVTLWFALDKIPLTIWISQRGGRGGGLSSVG